MLWNCWACMPTTSGWWVDKWLCTFFFKQFSVLNVHCITSHCQLGNLHELWKLLSQQPQGTSPCQSFVNELKGKSPFTTTWQFAFIVILNMKVCSSTLRVRGWHAPLLPNHSLSHAHFMVLFISFHIHVVFRYDIRAFWFFHRHVGPINIESIQIWMHPWQWMLEYGLWARS